MAKYKFCRYCEKKLSPSTISKICKKCHDLYEYRRTHYRDFKCEPPYTCFNCPFPDCVSTSKRRTQEETEYIKCAGFKK